MSHIMTCRCSTTFLYILTTYLLFLICQTASTLKPYIRPAVIADAVGPFYEDYLYVDKTKYALKFAQEKGAGNNYFFVRPRRFGKSTFLRTLQKVFEGRQEIFNGTHIHRSNYSWESYPVLYLDFGNSKEYDCNEVMLRNQTRFEEELASQLADFKAYHKLSYEKKFKVLPEFSNILKELKMENGTNTVVLIDEYDMPVLSNMKECHAAAEINKRKIEAIFTSLKTCAGYIKFAFVTGVSKSVFTTFTSSIDLIDISNYPKFHEIAGITESDLDTYYAEHIAQVAKHRNLSKDNVTRILKDWYDGYKFAGRVNSRLYCPLSVHSYFENGGVAKPYYNDKNHAAFLFDRMLKRPQEFSNLNLEVGVRSNLKGENSLDHTSAGILLYNAGYLTIQYMFEDGSYMLQFPNKEMQLTYHKDIADAALQAKDSTAPEVDIIGNSFNMEKPHFHTFMAAINTALMKLSLRPKYEKWYHYETHSFMDQAGLTTQVETPISTAEFGNRRPDITGSDMYTCFLFEVKVDRAIREAYIQANKSIKAFLEDDTLCSKNKNLLVAGITFSSNVMENVVKAYQAKLFARNGRVIKKYESKQFIPQIETDKLFTDDELFLKSRSE